MTEYELLDLTTSTIASMYDAVALYMTIVSGYLLVAYLAGSNLTRVQTTIISTLFVFGAGLQIWGLISYQIANEEYLAAKAMISPLTPYQQTLASQDAGFIISSILGAGVFASLYFMWSVRRPNID